MKSLFHGTHIPSYKELTNQKEIVDYLNPDYVYFPVGFNNVKYKLLKNIDDDVLLGEPLLYREGRFLHPVCSSVSGKITGIKKMWHSSGKMVEMVEVKNDFQNTLYYKVSKLDVLDKDHIVKRIKEAGIVGLGGAGFPTYIKYLPYQECDNVIINAVECEPYITSDAVNLVKYPNEVIKGIKYIMIANKSKRAFIAVKKNNTACIEALKEALSNEVNIKLVTVPNIYPAGWEKYLVNRIIKKDYKILPRESSTIVNNLRTCLAVYDAIEHNNPLTTNTITLSGDLFTDPVCVNVRIGTKLSDVIKQVTSYKDCEKINLIAGGPMTGTCMLSDDLILTANVNAVIALKVDDSPYTSNCINCGRCATVCPNHLTPTLIKQAYLSDDINSLINLNVNKCVKCGLCSYVCPSRQEITNYVDLAKNRLEKAKEVNKL